MLDILKNGERKNSLDMIYYYLFTRHIYIKNYLKIVNLVHRVFLRFMVPDLVSLVIFDPQYKDLFLSYVVFQKGGISVEFMTLVFLFMTFFPSENVISLFPFIFLYFCTSRIVATRVRDTIIAQ